jgi:hypothetical protein
MWSFADAYPVNWEVENFNATKNAVAIEKIELAYSTSRREEGAPSLLEKVVAAATKLI